jgi:hypothetical protein
MTINLSLNFDSTHLLNWELNSRYGSFKKSNFDYGSSFEN